jgi:hypothetical protein
MSRAKSKARSVPLKQLKISVIPFSSDYFGHRIAVSFGTTIKKATVVDSAGETS